MQRLDGRRMSVPVGDGCIAPDWPAPARVRACATTRWVAGHSKPPFDAFNLGSRCGDEPDGVAANRDALVRRLALPAVPCWLRQVHGTTVFDADGVGIDAEPAADAAVTRRAGRVLAVLTADCLPVLFCVDDGSAVAAAHAGWRGLAAGVLEATLATLRVPPSRLIAWIGPAIGAMSYEVGEEVRSAFIEADDGAAAAFASTRPGHWQCDLPLLARRRLSAAGVVRVGGGDFDTFRDERFYSYRRERETGRFATLVWIAP
jgi:YfiH family protein